MNKKAYFILIDDNVGGGYVDAIIVSPRSKAEIQSIIDAVLCGKPTYESIDDIKNALPDDTEFYELENEDYKLHYH